MGVSDMEDTYDNVAKPLGHFVFAFNDLEVAASGALMRLLEQGRACWSRFSRYAEFLAKACTSTSVGK